MAERIMKGKKISKGKLIFLIVMLFALVAAIMCDYLFWAESRIPECYQRYESYYSYRGKIEEIEAWSIDPESNDHSANYVSLDTAYISNDPYMSGLSSDNVRIKVVGNEGERWFFLDGNTYIYNDIRDENNGYQLKIGDRIYLAYALETAEPYAVAIKWDMRAVEVTVLSAFASLVYLILVIIFWPVYNTDKGASPSRLAVVITVVVVLVVIMISLYVGYLDYMARVRSAKAMVRDREPVIELSPEQAEALR